ncbi:MAG: hypothetical protein JWN55_329 [Frankiales bacterium]|jgi:hypothetical protein|nr:hypothetical protein [Frankiales bacterium]
MRGTTKLIGAVAVAGLVATGGSAFTGSNSLPAASVTKGYGSQTITGVTATSVTYTTDTPGSTITSVGLILTGDTTTKVIQIAFNDAAPATCSAAGTYTIGTPGSTAYTCAVTQDVTTAAKFALVAV